LRIARGLVFKSFAQVPKFQSGMNCGK